MSDPGGLESQRVMVPTNQRIILLADSGLPGSPVPSPEEFTLNNHLIFPVQNSGGVVLTGIDTGLVTVTPEPRDTEPTLDMRGWEEAVDVSIHVHGDLALLPLFDAGESYPPLTQHGAGDYRVRCYARGRAAQFRQIVTVSDEEYRIVTWPAAAAQAIIHSLLPPDIS